MRRRPGEVRDAIVEYLRRRGTDATVAEIRLGVESLLEVKVAASSVRSYLGINEGDMFERTARGRYRLSRP